MTTKEIQKIVGVTPDGIMGPKTKAAIKAYQTKLGVTADGIWGPKTEAAYNSKNTTVVNKSTPTSTVNKSTPTTSTKTKSSTSSIPEDKLQISSTLNLGSTGEDVKRLQTYLQGQGAVGSDGKPLKVDGIYGPDTKTAVMQFQSKNGLVADGIFGSKSIAKYNEIRNTPVQINSAAPETQPDNTTSSMTDTTNPNDGGTIYNTGDPTQDALLKTLQDFIKAQQDAGLKINEALNFDQGTLDKFLETAKKQVHPYYAEQIDAIKQDVLRAAPQILQNYENEVAKAGEGFQEDLGTTRESAAGAGTVFSGARAKGEQGMKTSLNRSLADLSQTYGNKLYDLGRTAEQKIGSSATPSLGDLTNYSASLSGGGKLNKTGTYTPYTPGGFNIGSLTQEEEAAKEQRRQALLKTAQEAVVAGRSYNDLFQ